MTARAERGETGVAEPPPAEEFRDGIWALPMTLPQVRLPYSFSYLVADAAGAWHVIDTGWSLEHNYERLVGLLSRLGADVADIASITVTHLHLDHSGLAARIRDESGGRLQRGPAGAAANATGEPDWWLSGDERLHAWGVPEPARHELAAVGRRPVPDLAGGVVLADGALLDIPGRRMQVLHTPGHTGEHICIHALDEAVVFTGDHLMPTINPGLGLGGVTASNPLEDYLDSLARLAPLHEVEAAPGHQHRFRGVPARSRAAAEHVLRRTREVAVQLDNDPSSSIWDIASTLTWSAGWENLSGYLLRSALAQTAMHVQLVRSGAAHRFLP